MGTTTTTGWIVYRNPRAERGWLIARVIGDLVEGDELAEQRHGRFRSRRTAAAAAVLKSYQSLEAPRARRR